MPTKTRTESHRSNPVKAGGVVYTPPALALFLAKQAFDSLASNGPVRILDPACGDGELLLAAAEEAQRRGILVEQIVGVDINSAAIEVARERLAGLGGVELRAQDFLSEVAYSGDTPSLLDDASVTLERFNLVISNPPYVRTQTLGAKTAQLLGKRFGLTGRVDLYQAFAVAMIESLAPGGALGLLCSNKFLTNRGGAATRRLLVDHLQLDAIVDLGDTKLFEAAVLPVIVSGSKPTSDQTVQPPDTAFVSVYESKTADTAAVAVPILEALRQNHSGLISDGARYFMVRQGQLDRNADLNQPWVPIDEATRLRFATIRRTAIPDLGSLASIKVGIKTTADSVFIRTDWDDLPVDLQPEPELLRPLLTHHDIEPWNAAPGLRRVLYPHVDRSGKAKPVDLDEYPRTRAYLESHRERLEGRSYVNDSGRQWFEIWVPQKPALWALPKIVFPDIAETPRFAIDRSEAIVNGDCYWMAVEDDDLADVIAAVGNSSFCTWFYDAACGNFLYAGRRRFMTQYMERLPIPKPTTYLVDEIRGLRRAGDLEALDALVWSAVGLEHPGRHR